MNNISDMKIKNWENLFFRYFFIKGSIWGSVIFHSPRFGNHPFSTRFFC